MHTVVNELAGKVAVVTGGSAGIGHAIVERFAQEGARVVIGDRDSQAGELLAKSLGANAIFAETDVSDPGQVTRLVAAAVEHFGGLDVMVNNAGISGAMHASF